MGVNRKGAIAVLAIVSLCWLAAGVAGEKLEQPWFDLTNCSMCKHLGAEPGLIDSMKWETHMLDDGIMTIATIPAEQMEAFERAGKNMEAVAAKMQTGEAMPLCGFCMSYGKLMAAGAKVQEVHSAVGHIGLITSPDPQVAKMIRAHGQRTMDEYAKWIAERAGTQ